MVILLALAKVALAIVVIYGLLTTNMEYRK